MATGSGHTGGADGTETDNVIRFPRDWFGSKDDLIPFGPSADRIRAERAARQAEAEAAADPAAEPTTAEPSTAEPTSPEDAAFGLSEARNASDFWSEDAATLHEPVDVIAAFQSDAELTAHGRLEEQLAPSRSGDGAMAPVGRARLGPRRASAALVAGLIVLACAAFVISHAGGSRHRIQLGAATVTATGATPPVVHHSALAATERNAGSRFGAEVRRQAMRTRAEVVKRRDAEAERRKKRAAQLRAKRERANAAAAKASTSEGHSSDVSTGSSSGSSSGSAAESDPPAVSASPASESEAGSGSGSGSGSSSGEGAPGPAGPGGAAGPNCNPTCSGN